MTRTEIDVAQDAAQFVQGWVSGYMAHGGRLTDEGMADKAAAAWRRRLHPPELPAGVQIRLEDAIAAVEKARS